MEEYCLQTCWKERKLSHSCIRWFRNGRSFVTNRSRKRWVVRDLCAAHISSQKNVTDIYWRGLHHPDLVTHQYIADTVSYVFFHNTVCHSESHVHLTVQEELDRLQLCSPPSSSYSAHDIHSTLKDIEADSGGHPLIILNNWKLREDRKGKPGWITNSAESSISFPMRFGDHPRLIVSYLKSYRGLGKVRMTLNNR